MNSSKVTTGVARTAEALAACLALFAVLARPMFPGLASPLHRNILIHLAIFMAALLATLATALRKRLDFRARAVTAALLVFVATTALAAAFAENRYAATVRALDLASWCVLAIVLAQAVSTPFRARVALAALLAGFAVLAADAFYQFLVALPAIRGDLDGHVRRMVSSGTLHPSMVEAFRKRAATGDVFGNFITANGFAGYLILLAPAAAMAVWVRFRERTTRMALGAALMALVALGGLAALALTRSKGGWLALAVALGGWGAFAILSHVRRETAAAVALALAAAWLVAPSGGGPDNAPAAGPVAPRAFWLGDSAEVRVEYWKAGWETLKSRPWVGVGPGNFADHYVAFRTPEGSETRHAHNDYLEIAVEQGALGLAAFLAVWAAWWVALARREGAPAADPDDASSRRAFVVAVGIAGALAILFVMSRFMPTAETEAMLGAGLALWVLVYWAQVRAVSAVDPDASGSVHARWLRGAVGAGVAALMVHMAIDFDFSEPGITATLAGMMAVGLGLREPRCIAEAKGFRFGAVGQAGLVAIVAAPMIATLVVFFYPLIDMSVALEQAQEAREKSARLMRQSEEWRARGNMRGADALIHDAEETILVEYPRRLEEAIRAWPGNPEPWMELARMESAAVRADRRADLSKLRKLLARAKALAPRDPAPWALLADVLAAQMRSADADGAAGDAQALASAALQEIDAALSRYPAQPKMHLTRARLLDRLGRKTEAVEEFRRAIDLADRTSEKELKFTPEELRDIRLALRRLEGGGAR